jgi:uncharacterized protein involved in type VI secretion and phage assembly
MSLPDGASQPPQSRAETSHLFGVYPAIVTNNRDPDKLGMVKVRILWFSDPRSVGYEVWARVATLMAGLSNGTWFIPDVDDEVLVAFEAGDARRPYVVGALWNGRDTPPSSAMDQTGQNATKVIRSRNGISITFDDTASRERLTLDTPTGQRITLKDGPGVVEIRDGNGNTVVLDPSGVTVTASAKLTLRASQVAIAAGMLQVDAGTARFSGTVMSDSIVTNRVASASYTPGSGNLV